MAGPDAGEDNSGGEHSQDSPSEETIKNDRMEDKSTVEKPSLMKRIWTSSGLNVGMLILMFKGALPPTISLAIYESTPVARVYSTLGYLVAIMSVLSFPILPRSKFTQTMMLNILAVCIAACMALLEIYCSVQARAHTTPAPSSSSNGPSPGAAVSAYNSSAAAVCAIWYFFNIYIANALRALRPQLQFPVIVYSIFVSVASVYAPSFPTMAAGIAFAERLLESFLTGFAIATGVSLFVFPITVRKILFKQSAGYIQLVQGTLNAQLAYIHSLETTNVFATPSKAGDEGKKGGLLDGTKANTGQADVSAETLKLKASIAGLAELHSKMYADIEFAKRETAWGKLDAPDISEMLLLLQGIILPLTGVSSVADIFQRLSERWRRLNEELAIEPSKQEDVEEHTHRWNEIMKTLHDPFQTMTEAMNSGLQHALYTLELAKPPKKKKQRGEKTATRDIEAEAGPVKPGDPGYSKSLEHKINAFYEKRKSTLAVYCQQRGITMDEKVLDNVAEFTSRIHKNEALEDEATRQRNKRQLYLVLYMEYLLWSTGRAVLSLVQFADRKVEDGTMSKNRLIYPGTRRLKKWLISVWKEDDGSTDHTPDATESGGSGIYSGQSYETAKDPEHLPPTNALQRFGNSFRGVGDFFGSAESTFGFRVGCATMSIGIIAFLGDTRPFFLEQRLVWALIMVAIGMTITAGSGVFGFLGRITGTFIAMCTSFVIWYIVNGHPAGVIVFVFVFVFVEFYFILKYPRFVIVAILSIVTQTLIIGYELEVQKVGEKIATSNGQPYYQIFLLAPYRLACVSGGMFVAFFWTFFPYPLTARSQLRKDLGASLYLLANFYSIVHTTVGLRVNGTEGDLGSKKSPGRKLGKIRDAVYLKEVGLLAGLRQHSSFTAWEPSFGGKFPKKQYDDIIQEVNKILNYLALISYASRGLAHESSTDPNKSTWIEDFSRLIGSIQVTSQEITSTLTLLSAAVTNGNRLPPYLKAPRAYQLSQKLEALDPDILSISHMAEPGYSAFAMMQIASSLVSDDIGKLIENVKGLVGEVDFSFHIISTAQSSEDALLHKGKND